MRKKIIRKIIKIDNQLLTEFQIATFQNAKRLLLEAEYLLKQGLFPSSAFLAITSIEEMGKFYLTRIISIKSKNNELTEKDLNNLQLHPIKQLNSFLPPFPFKNGKQKLSKNISRFWELNADKELMNIRNNCLYSDFDIEKGVIQIPSNSVKKNDALYFLETAFEIILLQIESLLTSLDCLPCYLFLEKESKLLKEKYTKLKI